MVRQQEISKLLEYANKHLHYDKETGVITRKTTVSSHKARSRAGFLHFHGYRHIGVLGRQYKEHRFIWLMVHGKWPDGDIDHINHNMSDNRLSNLRDVSTSGNMQNQIRAHKRNQSGLIGVTKISKSPKKPWRARIRIDKQEIYLGIFATKEEAFKVYLEAKAKYHNFSVL